MLRQREGMTAPGVVPEQRDQEFQPGGASTTKSDTEHESNLQVLFGETIDLNERLQEILKREEFLLSVMIPRTRTFSDAMREWFTRSATRAVSGYCALVFVLHLGAFSVCSTQHWASTVCGPDVDSAMSGILKEYAFGDYGPPLLNMLATLMLSFYANVCMGLYREGYFAAQELKESVQDFVTMVAGTIPPDLHEMRMEFWRCINLFHLTTYVLADKSRGTYSLDEFALPVAKAYGEHNGIDKLGMLTSEELRVLSFPISNHRASNYEQTLDGQPKRETSASIATQALKTKGNGLAILNNARGDVLSRAASLNAALGVRLVALVDLAIEGKISKAPWPSWSPVCLKLRSKAEAVKQRALFRLPRIYNTAVRFFVISAILVDTWMLSSHPAQLWRQADDSDWRTYTWFWACLNLVLNMLLTWCLAIFLEAIRNMQTPFGSDPIDMPGLSYVCAAAALSLRTILGGNSRTEKDTIYQAFSSPESIDRNLLLRGRGGRLKTKD